MAGNPVERAGCTYAAAGPRWPRLPCIRPGLRLWGAGPRAWLRLCRAVR